MNQFLERYNLPKLIQEEMDNLNRHISFKEIVPIINKLTIQKSPGPDRFAGELYQIFKVEILPILYFFQEIEAGGIFPNYSLRPTITEHQNQAKTNIIDQYFS